VASELAEIFTKWGIREKIVTVVSDNGANIKSANDHLRKHHHLCIGSTIPTKKFRPPFSCHFTKIQSGVI
jgi:hypothetical protein